MSEADIVTTEMILGWELEPEQRAFLACARMTPQQAARFILAPPHRPNLSTSEGD